MEKLTLCLLIHGSLHFYYYLFDAHILSDLASVGLLSRIFFFLFLFCYVLLSFEDLPFFFVPQISKQTPWLRLVFCVPWPGLGISHCSKNLWFWLVEYSETKIEARHCS